MSTQLIGFSIGGISRRFLVDPPSMSELFLLLFLTINDVILYYSNHQIIKFGLQIWSHAHFLTRFTLRNTLVWGTVEAGRGNAFSSFA